MTSTSRSPDSRRKRLKLDDEEGEEEGPALPPTRTKSASIKDSESDGEDHCVICLQIIVDRTVLPGCAHDRFCFECLEMWTSQSRKVCLLEFRSAISVC